MQWFVIFRCRKTAKLNKLFLDGTIPKNQLKNVIQQEMSVILTCQYYENTEKLLSILMEI